MTVAVANTELTNSFDYMRQRVNELADAMSTVVLTADEEVSANLTLLGGTLEANNVYVRSALRGGNTSVANVLYITSNVTINTAITANSLLIGNSSVFVTVIPSAVLIGANVLFNASGASVGNSTVNAVVNSTSFKLNTSSTNAVINTSGFFIGGELFGGSRINVQTSGTSSQIIDEIVKAEYRTAEYTISITDNNSTNYQASKLLLSHDGTVGYINEYGVINTGSSLGTFSANVNGANCELVFTPLSSNTQVKATRNMLPV